jgi:hypothetical protein
LDRTRDPTFRCTALGESASNFDPHPDSALSDWNNEEIGESRRISENMIGVRSWLLLFLKTAYRPDT